jgi:hypothetical protein
MKTLAAGILCLTTLLLGTLALAQDSKPADAKPAVLAQRFVYISGNFMREPQVDEAIANVKKAAAAGYNAVLVTDCKFSRWDDKATVDQPQYILNVQKFTKAAKDLGMKVVACVGAQNADMMAEDTSLAEGMPVKDAPFVVKDGKLVPDDDIKLVNPSFEDVNERDANQPVGWNVDFPGKCGFLDDQVKFDGKRSLRYEDIKTNSSYGNGRANQALKVKPWRYYHVSVMIKTQDFDAPRTFNAMALGKTNGLVHQTFEIKPTQDWTKIDIVFNTLDNDTVSVYFGSWGGQKGKMWIDDVKIEPAGFVNLIRRPSLTFKITSEDGKTTYEEGKDFSPVRDPKMLNVKWPGDHAYWYEQPTVTIPEGSKLKNGDKVLASYSHAMNTLGWGVFACMAEPRTMELVAKNIKYVHKYIQPDGYMLPYDEIRHLGWDESCVKTGKTACQMLIDNTKACVEIIRKEDPGKPLYAWNDMFDPFHNAGKNGYDYLVKGKDPFYGSWEGLDKDVIIMNWMGDAGKRVDSMKHFAGRGHKQVLCGYYDAPSENMAPWLKDAKDVPGIVGVMYTTWANNFSELEKYMTVCEQAAKP